VVEVDVTATVADPLGPAPPLTPPFAWTQFAHYFDPWAAYIVAGLLENEGVMTYIESHGILGASDGYAALWVPHPLVHRARWILALGPPTEAELLYLATGELTYDLQP
jgi:hypothetical protein